MTHKGQTKQNIEIILLFIVLVRRGADFYDYSLHSLQVFSLPGLSAREKYKLTASEGSKIRKVSYVNFRSQSGKQS